MRKLDLRVARLEESAKVSQSDFVSCTCPWAEWKRDGSPPLLDVDTMIARVEAKHATERARIASMNPTERLRDARGALESEKARAATMKNTAPEPRCKDCPGRVVIDMSPTRIRLAELRVQEAERLMDGS